MDSDEWTPLNPPELRCMPVQDCVSELGRASPGGLFVQRVPAVRELRSQNGGINSLPTGLPVLPQVEGTGIQILQTKVVEARHSDHREPGPGQYSAEVGRQVEQARPEREDRWAYRQLFAMPP